jgi:hypothetical protein
MKVNKTPQNSILKLYLRYLNTQRTTILQLYELKIIKLQQQQQQYADFFEKILDWEIFEAFSESFILGFVYSS